MSKAMSSSDANDMAEARHSLGPCVICGEQVWDNDEPAEMHNPENPEEEGGICHAGCGLSMGWKVS